MPQAKPSLRIVNIVAVVTLNQGLDLPSIVKALPGAVYRRDRFPGLVFKLREPRTATLIFSSGKMVCTGATSEGLARKAVQRVIGELKSRGILIIGEPIIRVQNMVASASLAGRIDVERASFTLGRTMYEPEQFPGLIYRMDDPRVVFLIFASGEIVVLGARSEGMVAEAVGRLKAQLEEETLISY